MKKSFGKVMLCVLIATGGSVVGIVSGGTASAYLTNCTGAVNNGTYTTGRCTTAVGGGLQRVRQTCSNGSQGSIQYGSWTAVGGTSRAPTSGGCALTVSARVQEFTD